MRDILFKAKRIDNGEWVEGTLIDSGNHYQVFIYPNDDSASTMSCKTLVYHGMVAVDSNTICQYTGLTDKNGKKIWENDILIYDDCYSLVRWSDEEARFVIDDYGTKGCLMEYGFDEDAGGYGVVDTNGFDDFCSMKSFEVIGNVFDNPELLKGGAE